MMEYWTIYIFNHAKGSKTRMDGLLFYQLIQNKLNEADILARSAKSVSARHYAIYELDMITGTYIQGWVSRTEAKLKNQQEYVCKVWLYIPVIFDISILVGL